MQIDFRLKLESLKRSTKVGKVGVARGESEEEEEDNDEKDGEGERENGESDRKMKSGDDE